MFFKKRSQIASLMVLLCLSYTAKASDTLVYRSDFEERLFRDAGSKHVDFTALFSAINSDSVVYRKYASRLNTFYASINDKITAVKSARQKAKVIFKEVHSHFFVKYEENAFFNKIFEGGKYNCLTASMLYSLVLTNYNIPFEIKEKPTHVYLVGLPGTDNILFETTNPAGFYVPNEKLKREYIASLVSLKLVTQEYVNSVGMANAFNEFYYNSDNINSVQLAGLQYYNEAIFSYTDGNIDNAITSAIKANILYPCPKHIFLKTSFIKESLDNSNFESLRDILYLAEFANSIKDTRDKKFVIGAFENILNNKLIKNGNDTFINEAYRITQARITDTLISRDISYSYYLGMGYWHSVKGDMDQTLAYVEKAFALNQKDARLHELVIQSLVLKTDKLKGKASSISLLTEYAERFPFLKTHKTFKSLLVYQYAFRAYGLFLKNSGEDGYTHLTRMEDELKSMNEKTIIGSEMIGMAYAEAGAFHFRKHEYKKAKEIILKGLTITPDHGELEERLRIVDTELNR
jgi:tetratricopeptide (TPR) repeat protein